MANHCSTVAQIIRRPTVHGITRVGHDLATKIVKTLIKTRKFAFLFLI